MEDNVAAQRSRYPDLDRLCELWMYPPSADLGLPDHVRETIAWAFDQIVKARDELAEARKDRDDLLSWLQRDERQRGAERHRIWIITTCCGSEWVVSEWGDDGADLGSGPTLRAAIDEEKEK